MDGNTCKLCASPASFHPTVPMGEDEAIAIVGIGCRFPGDANDPDTFWRILRDGVDALTEIPADRWDLRTYYDPEPGRVGKTNIRYGGFVKGIDRFDAGFFGISPREASRMDPQQRLLLEVAWEALEDGGQVLERLAGGPTSVFVGISSYDYSLIQAGYRDRQAIDVYSNTGGALCIAANRIAYCLDFKGPNAAVDSACSSALFAVHLACQTLWSGQCETALAGGVNVLITPGPYLGFSQLAMMSSDGRCKAFDARADGFVRSEGAGMVVLKALSKALADGDPIYALIRGTASNQDGHTTGLTVPSQQAQEALVREACRCARVDPAQVQFVEAHGTGTIVGDPIEAKALGGVLSAGRPEDKPLLIGSVKTNLGHLEAAAGIAGLIKTALALKHRVIPPNLHFEQPNPNIPFEALRLRVPQTLEPWPETDGPAIAGVNSFGFGGSNTHVILQEPPREVGRPSPSTQRRASASLQAGRPSPSDAAPTAEPAQATWAQLVPLSARSPEALRALAESYQRFFQEGGGAGTSLADLCFTTRFRRTHHDHRSAVVTHSMEEFIEQLGAIARGEPNGFVVSDRVIASQETGLAFVFSGQGPQWWAMGRQLLQQEPVFSETIHACDRLIRQFGSSWSLIEELTVDESQSRMSETGIAQPSIFAIQAALAALWRHWGIEPDAIVGHSVGEVAAAHVAGVLSLEDAVRVIYHRGRCMEHASTEGRMLAVGLPVDEARRAIEPFGEQISLAAINSPNSLTVSGHGEALEQLAQSLESRNVFCRFLRVNHAFHSRDMDPICDELLESLEGIRPRPATIPLLSTVTAQWVNGSEMTPDYWWQNVRKTVRFADAVNRLLETKHNVFLEISPHPVLGSAVMECVLAAGKQAKVLGSLRRKEEERATMLRSLGALYALGHPLDWSVQQGDQGRFIRLPSYAWQRESYWHEAEESRDARLGLRDCHPLLGRKLPTPHPTWETSLDTNWVPFLSDHKVQGHVLVPGAAFVEMALAAAKDIFGAGPFVLEDVRLVKACFLPKGETAMVRTGYAPHDSSFNIHSQLLQKGHSWNLHVSGFLASRREEPREIAFSFEEVQARCPEELSGSDCYEALEQMELNYGPTFQGIRQLWIGENEALGRIVAPEAVHQQIGDYQFHPALLDACFQVIMGAIPKARLHGDTGRGVYLPVAIEEVRVYGGPEEWLWCHARLREINRQGLSADVRAFDDNGRLILDVRGLQCQYTGIEGGDPDALDDLLYEFRWLLRPRRDRESTGRQFGHLPALETVAASVRSEAERLIAHVNTGRYQGLETEMNRLCAAYVADALARLGLDFAAGHRFTSAGMADRLGIAPQHRRLLNRYFKMLAQEGVLVEIEASAAIESGFSADPDYQMETATNEADVQRDEHCNTGAEKPVSAEQNTDAGGAWEVVRPPAFGDSEPLWARLLTENPAFFAELTLIRRCGHHLAEVLRGDMNPLQLIFPDGSLDTAEHLYQDSPSVRFCNTLAQHAISQVLEEVPEDRRVRILEIGAGTGGLTSFVLPRLPADRTEYVFTDLSKHFFIKGGQKFADYPFVEYKILDIEKDPVEQGFAEHSFDLVLASQVLHATTDLRRTLENVKRLMAGDGLLVLLEVVKPARWIDLVFGLTEGWWRFADRDLRPEYPLLSFPKWKELLGQLGFTETVDVSSTGDTGGFGSAVILARGPAIDQPAESRQIQSQPAEERSAEQAVETPETESGHWLIFADRGGLGERLALMLRDRGDNCSLVFAAESFSANGDQCAQVRPNRLEDMRELLAEWKVSGKLDCRGVVYLWNLDAPRPENLRTRELEKSLDTGFLSVVHLMQAWTEITERAAPLWLVTRAAQSVDGRGGPVEPISPAQTCLWGLGRVLMNEYPKFKCKLVDLGSTGSDADTRSLFEELCAPDDEDEIAFRGEARYVHRYQHGALESNSRNGSSDGQSETVPYRLEVPRFGFLDGLKLRVVQRSKPGPHQVEIRVMATALNFSDVMKALGLYPGLPDGPVPLGIECAGKVVAVGEGVENFHVGDDVVAIAPFSFGTYVTTYTPLVAHKPESITYEEAATLPIAFLTADYALNYLGRLSAGERVLIHSATGGVGLAAIQLARRAGAEIFATAGSTEKREFLKSLGIEHVMDSRSLAFADEIMEATGGQGVDVVLNSLSGEAIFKSLSVLGEYGRFLEIGKRDIYMNSRLGMRPFKKNLSFIAIDLDRAIRQRPAVLSSRFQQIMRDVREGRLAPLPHRVFSITNVVAAFRHMAQAKHIGKNVVSLQEQVVSLMPPAVEPVTLRSEATYLITGGLGGFGLALARWMVEQGARHLVLMGRRGVHSPESQRAVEALEKLGARVVVARGDVSDPEHVARVLAQIAESMPPLRGVVHAAMVLEDCLVQKLDHERMMRVIGPKMSGAWNLHTQTLGIPLDLFVCFSSMASVFGLPGQANYAASNTFIDSLAYYRRGLGLPALTVNWGYLRDVGYVARNEQIGERFEGQGLKSFSPREALALLGRLLRVDPVQVGVMRMDWSRFRSIGVSMTASPRFSILAQEGESGQDGQTKDGLAVRKMLLAAPPEQRKQLLLDFLREKVGRVLGAPAEKIDLQKPLTEIGLDSLMAVELRNWIEGELRVNLPVMELMQGPSVDRMADILLAQLTGEAAVAPAAPQPLAADSGTGPRHETAEIDQAKAQELLTRVDKLSQDELDELLETLEEEEGDENVSELFN